MDKTTDAGLRYEPDYAVPPGESLLEILDERGMSQAELARRTGISPKHVNLMVKGAASISPDTALKLDLVLGVPARVWNSLEANYQGHVSRLQSSKELMQYENWASRELMKELMQRGFIERAGDKVEQVRQALRFFGVASVSAWSSTWDESAATAAYRKAKLQGDPVALAAWMRIGELRAAEVETEPFDRARLREVLLEVRALTRQPSPAVWCARLEELCSSAGVVVIIEKELPKARVNGIARWLTPSKALIQLSLRYLRDDIFWFTFFHEAGHLILHGKRSGPRDIPQTFIDPDLPTFIDTGESGGPSEDEANAFASDMLIPVARIAELQRLNSLADVSRFAEELGVSPGIVVGRLHHEGLKPHSWGAGLFVRYRFAD